MRKFSSSLRTQLVLFISLPLVFTALIIGSVSLMSTYEEISEVYDAQLVHSAKVLLQLTEHEASEEGSVKIRLGDERSEIAHPYENNITFRVWKGDGLITQSYQAEAFGKLKVPEGFSNQTIGREDWRFFVFSDNQSGLRVEVAERYEVRADLIYKILAGLFLSLCFFIPVPLAIVWIGVAKSLKPMTVLSKSVDDRDVNDFHPIETVTVPREIHPFIRAINRLLKRIEDSFERERQFTDNAAHELKTPLAAMKMQTQVLIKKIGHVPDYMEGLTNLHASIDRASHMVDQLLLFARLQAEHIEFSKVDLSSLLNEVLRDFAPLALRKEIELTADILPNLDVNGNRNALLLMMRNILDNAVKFTPDHGQIHIKGAWVDQQVVLEFSDTGIGIPDADKSQVFERFYRIKKSDTPGSGLGLSMVKWVCELHTIKNEFFDNVPNGLVVRLTFN